MKDALRLLFATVVIVTVFILYRDFLLTDMGIFHRNDCGTYDRWVIWSSGSPNAPVHVPMFPNGLLGKNASDCKEVVTK